MGSDLVVFMPHFDGVDEKVYENNFQSFVRHNPDADVVRFDDKDCKDPYWQKIRKDKHLAWRNCDLLIYDFYRQNPQYEHYLYVEWDTYCTMNVRKIVEPVVSAGLACKTIFMRPMDGWGPTFRGFISEMPNEVQDQLLGLCSLCPTYIHRNVLEQLAKPHWLKDQNLFCELRMGTIARLSNVKPVEFPLYRKGLTAAGFHMSQINGEGLWHQVKYRFSETPPQGEDCELAGVWHGFHPHWTSKLLLNKDGTMSGDATDRGRWLLYPDGELILGWDNYPPEQLFKSDDGFTNGSFTLYRYMPLVRRRGKTLVEDPSPPPANISLITTVSHSTELIPHFLKHYREMGIKQFVFAVKKELDGVDNRDTMRDSILAMSQDDIWVTSINEIGDSGHAYINVLARQLHTDWILPADLDEFQWYPQSLSAVVKSLNDSNRNCVVGYLIDRVTADGSFPKALPNDNILETFPRAVKFSEKVMKQNCRKVMLARPTVKFNGGEHSAEGEMPAEFTGTVWHIKWFGDVIGKLNAMLKWRHDHRYPWAAESSRALVHIQENHGIAMKGFQSSKCTKYGTTPFVLHANGPSAKAGRIWTLVKDQTPEFRIEVPNSVHIITWSNFSWPTRIEQQLSAAGVSYTVLGRDQHPWNHGYKITGLMPFLTNCQQDYVFSIDSDDALFIGSGSISLLINKMKALGCKMLFGGETNPWPPNDCTYVERARSSKLFKHLNGGVYLAETKALIDFVRRYGPCTCENDQRFFKNVFAAEYPKVLIDDTAEFFLNLHDADNIVELI